MNAIRSYRDRCGLSQTEFARLIGVRQTAVSNYEKGVRQPEHQVARRIESATNGAVTVHDLRPDIFGPPPVGDVPAHEATATADQEAA